MIDIYEDAMRRKISPSQINEAKKNNLRQLLSEKSLRDLAIKIIDEYGEEMCSSELFEELAED